MAPQYPPGGSALNVPLHQGTSFKNPNIPKSLGGEKPRVPNG